METIEHNPNNLPSADASRWTPVLNGNIFCSPACGCKCKLADYEKVVKAANALVSVLGGGWEPQIWENGGWHYEVSRGDVIVRYDNGDYTASLKVDYMVDCHILTVDHVSDDPRLAVDGLTLKLSAIIARLSRAKASASLELISIEKLGHWSSVQGDLPPGTRSEVPELN